MILRRSVLIIGQPAGSFKHQLGGLGLGVELHTGHDGVEVDRRGLRCHVAGVRLQWALAAVFFAEDGRSWQGDLQHIAFRVVGQDHSKALLIAASAAVACTRARDVLWALSAA